MLRLSSLPIRLHQAVGEPQQDQAHPREPDDRQAHSQKPKRAGHPGDPRRMPERSRAGGCAQQIIHPIELDLMGDEPEGQRGQQVDQGMAEKIASPVGRERQLEREFEEEHRADRQVGPGEEPVLPDREPLRAARARAGFARDQEEEHQDQDEDGVFEKSRRTAGRRVSPCGGRAAFPATGARPDGSRGSAPGPVCAGASGPRLGAIAARWRKLDRVRRSRPGRRRLRELPESAPVNGKEISSGKSDACILASLELRPLAATSRRAGPGRRRAGRGDRPRGAGSCPRGKPSSHPPRRAPSGRFARRRRCARPEGAIARRRSAAWASSVRRRSSSSIQSTAIERQVGVDPAWPVARSSVFACACSLVRWNRCAQRASGVELVARAAQAPA